jgi:glycosyltransferase involved in cell wall biosynthesis
MAKLISILIPVYNEEKNVPAITTAVHQALASTNYTYEIIFVNDGSKDNSLNVIKQTALTDSRVFYVSFSRNFGKDNALLAGLKHTKGDAVITIDADLQHPPGLIPTLISFWEQGNEVVYTYREDRNEHASGFNQFSSKLFYKIVNHLSSVELEDGIADYRLLDRKVVDVLSNLHEDYPFFRGLVKWVGFKQIGIPYTPLARVSGETKYNTKALMSLALQGLTSFSTKPLSIAIYLGFTFSALSLLYIPYVVISLYFARPISGWSSLIVTIAFFGGLQLMILGILGIYLGKLFMQSKQRPQFIIQEKNIE